MHLNFLIPLATALVSGYIFNKSHEEVAYLTAIITIFSLILTLILAPWQIQLLVLIFVLSTTKKLLQQNEYKLKLEQNKEKLNYSNNSQATPSQDQVVVSNILGKYRGTPWKSDQINNNPVARANSGLKYRGSSISEQKRSTSEDNDLVSREYAETNFNNHATG